MAEELEEVKAARSRMLKDKGKSVIFRARVQEDGEQCTRIFFKKAFSPKSVMSSVLVGEVEVEGEEVLEKVRAFYKDLYDAQKKVEEEEVRDYCQVVNNKLEEVKVEGLVKCITETEVEEVLKSMAKNKTLGKDGLPVEWYVRFWPILKTHLLEVLKLCIETGHTSSSMKEGVITLIFKNGERREVKNWRPITLLNVNYKLMAKLLANRLGLVASVLLGEGQVPGRRIMNILVLLHDLTSYAEFSFLFVLRVGEDGAPAGIAEDLKRTVSWFKEPGFA